MRILILTQTFPLSPTDATAHFMHDFAKGLADSGQNVTVLLPFNPKLQISSFQKINIVPYYYIWPKFLHLLGFGRTLKNDQVLRWFVYPLAPLYILFGTISLYNLVKKKKFDVINAHWILPNGIIAAIVAFLTKVPFVITLPGSDVYLARKNWFYSVLARFAVSQAKEIVSNSQQLLDDMRVKGRVISYGVPVNRGKRDKHKNVIVVTAGRRVEKKGFNFLKDFDSDIIFLPELEIDVFRKKLLEVDIFIAYSIRDSKGNLDDASLTILEAMAAGCCVIVTNLPGNANLISSGVNGFLVDRGNSMQLQKVIQKIKKSKKLRLQTGKAARKTINDHFTPDEVSRNYIKVFHSITNHGF